MRRPAVALAVGIAIASYIAPRAVLAADLCSKPYLTKTAVSELCAKGDGRGVAALVEKDNACRRKEAEEARFAIAAAGGSKNAADALTTLVRRMYHAEDGVGALQAAIDGVCWGVLHP